MAGKDLIDSVKVSGQIARALGSRPPEGFNYELFLDEQGQKISKSKGNGLTMEEWLTYASPESLSLFMFQKPREAKKLHFDVIPRAVDEYLNFLDAYQRQDWKNRLGNPVYHIHAGNPPLPETIGGKAENEPRTTVSFGLLLNLVAVANAEDKAVLWAFLKRYAPDASPETHPRLDALVGYAIRYFTDFVKPAKSYRPADEVETGCAEGAGCGAGRPADRRVRRGYPSPAVYEVGRAVPRYQDFKAKGATPDRPGVAQGWFQAIYQVLLGEQRGPRFGSFAAIYGLDNARALIAKGLSGQLISEHEAFLKGRAG